MKALALFLLCACGATPPEFFSIDPAFSPEQAETIRSAVSSWCEAVGYCPEERAAPRGRFIAVDSLPEVFDCPEGSVCKRTGHNDGDNVRLVPRDDLSALWLVAAHEFGHYCAEHTAFGLMAARHSPGDALTIDAEAIAAWKEGCE